MGEEALADRQFLPRYGFPIGLQKLQVIAPDESTRDGNRVKIREEDQFRLERPGLLALREYVPGSQLLVGGKLVTSRGLRMLVSRGCGFAICLKCGYADSERKVGNGQMDLPPGFLSHSPLTAISARTSCWQDGNGQALRNQTLAAREITDVLMLTFEGNLKDLARDEGVKSFGRARPLLIWRTSKRKYQSLIQSKSRTMS